MRIADRPYPALWSLAAVKIGSWALPTAIATLSLVLEREGVLGRADTVAIMGGVGLGLVSVALVAGNVSDRVGRKATVHVGIAISVLAAGLAMIAPSSVALLVAATAAGVGLGFQGAPSTAAVADLFPEGRVRAYAFLAAITAVGGAGAPVLTGVVASSGQSRAALGLGIPLALVGGLGLQLTMVNRRFPAKRARDPIGIVLSIAGGGILLLGVRLISAGPTGFAWTATTAGLALLGGFLAWEHRHRQPLLDLSLFRNRRFSAATAVSALSIFGIGGVTLLISQYAQFVTDLSPAAAAVTLAPMEILGVVGVLSSPILTRWFGPGRVVAGSLAVAAATCGGGALLLDGTARTSVFVSLAIVSISLAVVVAPLQAVIADSLPPGERGQGFGAAKVVKGLASTVGGAIVVGTFALTFSASLPAALQSLFPDGEVEQSTGTVGQALQMRQEMSRRLPPEQALRFVEAQHRAFSDAQQRALLVGAASLALGAVVSFVGLSGRRSERGFRESDKAT